MYCANEDKLFCKFNADHLYSTVKTKRL